MNMSSPRNVPPPRAVLVAREYARAGEREKRERVNFLRVGSSWVGCWGHSLSLLLPPFLLFVRTVSACAWFPGYFLARVTLCVFLVY